MNIFDEIKKLQERYYQADTNNKRLYFESLINLSIKELKKLNDTKSLSTELEEKGVK